MKAKFVLIGLLISSGAYAQTANLECPAGTPPNGQYSGRLIAQMNHDGWNNYRFRMRQQNDNEICVTIDATFTARYQLMRDAWLLGIPITIRINAGGAQAVSVLNQ